MNVPCYVWSERGSIEQGAIDQIKNASTLPFVFHHTALMADAHQGYGVSIGSVVALKNVICPSMVSSDIGCGLCAVRTSLTEIDTNTLKKIMGEIRKEVPVGVNKHKKEQSKELMPEGKFELQEVFNDYYDNKPIAEKEYKNSLISIGTLGSGNHFIEIQKGDDGHIWIMIHSGSRNLGKQVADYYNNKAVELNKKWYSNVPKEWQLAFLPVDSEEGQYYIKEMQYAVDFAYANRKLMMDRIERIIAQEMNLPKITFEPMINIAHNYASLENHFGENVWVHRKGATQAYEGQVGIIPGSQGSDSYIVRGKGNEESFKSCSHGAGRTMSRKKAKEELDLEEEKKKMDEMGVIHGMRNKDDLDEASSAYKNIDEVMENQKDLVDIEVRLAPLAVIKR
ncbi:MAG: RtcB family protein [bacterium]